MITIARNAQSSDDRASWCRRTIAVRWRGIRVTRTASWFDLRLLPKKGDEPLG